MPRESLRIEASRRKEKNMTGTIAAAPLMIASEVND
jgi:hypothetical protein